MTEAERLAAMTPEERFTEMKSSCFSISPRANSRALLSLNEPQAWNPESDALRRGQADAVRFRAEQILSRIDNGFGGVARKQALDLDQTIRWN